MNPAQDKPWFEEFMENKHYKKYLGYTGFQKSTVSALMKMLKEEFRGKELESEHMDEAMRSAVLGYKSNKGTAILVYKTFLKFLKDVHQVEISVKFPQIEVWNTFERQMYLAKVLQEGTVSTDDLSRELWVSERTLEADLKKLRGLDEDPIQILGQKFCIPDTVRKNGKVLFSSTVHPLFLTWNLTQVITTLKGLKVMAEDPLLKGYAVRSAEDLWRQLSAYAKKRVLFVSSELLMEDLEFYESLEAGCQDAFWAETRFRHTDGGGILMDCIKNDKEFVLEYLKEDGDSEFLTGCSCVPGSYQEDHITVSTSQRERKSYYDKVLRSAYKEEELY